MVDVAVTKIKACVCVCGERYEGGGYHQVRRNPAHHFLPPVWGGRLAEVLLPLHGHGNEETMMRVTAYQRACF